MSALPVSRETLAAFEQSVKVSATWRRDCLDCCLFFAWPVAPVALFVLFKQAGELEIRSADLMLANSLPRWRTHKRRREFADSNNTITMFCLAAASPANWLNRFARPSAHQAFGRDGLTGQSRISCSEQMRRLSAFLRRACCLVGLFAASYLSAECCSSSSKQINGPLKQLASSKRQSSNGAPTTTC